MTSRLVTMVPARLASGGDHARERWFVKKSVSTVIRLLLHRSKVLDATLCSVSMSSDVWPV